MLGKNDLLLRLKSAYVTSELLEGRAISMYDIFLCRGTKLNKELYLRHFNRCNIIMSLLDTPYDHYMESCKDRIADKRDDTDDTHS